MHFCTPGNGLYPKNGGYSSTASQNEQLLFLIRWYNVFSLSCNGWNIGNYNSMLQYSKFYKAWATHTCCSGNRQYPKIMFFSNSLPVGKLKYLFQFIHMQQRILNITLFLCCVYCGLLAGCNFTFVGFINQYLIAHLIITITGRVIYIRWSPNLLTVLIFISVYQISLIIIYILNNILNFVLSSIPVLTLFRFTVY